MRKILFSVFVTFSFSLFSQNRENFVKNHLIIKLTKEAYDEALVDQEENRFGIRVLDSINQKLGIRELNSIGKHEVTRTFLLVFDHEIDIDPVINFYEKSGLSVYAEPDYLATGGGEKIENTLNTIPNDTYFSRQWNLVNDGTLSGVGAITTDADVDMDEAWDIETGNPNLIIAISDSGLRLSHPDISSRIWTNSNEIPANGIDDDQNGYVDDIRGWDWVNNDNQPTDDLGHGTNIAGIIGAIPNNNLLYSGANWNSKLMILKSLNSQNTATFSAMANSVYYAVDNGAKVFSMSIGGGYSSTMFDAVSYANDANVVFVACMMNFNNDVPYFPAAFSVDFPNVIAVGSTNPNDRRTSPFFWSATSGSNYGPHINVVAPGNYIYGLNHTSNTEAGTYWGGTSQATPLVAAIASLLLSYHPTLTPLEVRNLLEQTAQDQVGIFLEDIAGFDNYMGHGRVNAKLALTELQQMLAIKEPATLKTGITITNPSKNNVLHLFCKEFPGSYSLSVFDMAGRLLHYSNVPVIEGSNYIPFQHPKGSYIVKFENQKYSKIFKVVK